MALLEDKLPPAVSFVVEPLSLVASSIPICSLSLSTDLAVGELAFVDVILTENPLAAAMSLVL